MDFFKQLAAQLQAIFGEMSAGRRFFVALVLVGTLAGLGYLIFMARMDSYVPLLYNLTEADAAKIDEVVRAENITPRYNTDHSCIYVPEKHADEMRMLLARQGLPQGGGVAGDPMGDVGPFASTAKIAMAKRQAIQNDLVRIIMTLEQVQMAKVMLAQPEPSVFENPNDPRVVTASVVVRLARGTSLGRDAVEGVVHLVAYAVPDLKPENVTVVDESGRILNRTGQDAKDSALNANTAQRRDRENALQENIQTMLDQTLGKGRSVVRVSAELDFNQSTEVMKTYDPDGAVVETSIMSWQSNGKGPSVPRGSPAANTNLPSEDSLAPSLAQVNPDELTNYEKEEISKLSETQTTKVTVPGKILKLAVSALIDFKQVEQEDAEGKKTLVATEWTAAEKTDLQNAIQAAGNLDVDDRGDQLAVSFMKFAVEEAEDDALALAAIAKLRLNRLIQFGIRWGVVTLLCLLFLWFVLRPMVRVLTAPMVTAMAEGPALEGLAQDKLDLLKESLPEGVSLQEAIKRGASTDEIARLISQQTDSTARVASGMLKQELSALAKDDPDQAAQLIKKWLES